MGLVVRRGGFANKSLLIRVIMFGGIGVFAAKSLLGRDLHGQAVTLIAPFVVFAVFGIYVAWRGAVRAVVDDAGLKVFRLFATDVIGWEDLIGLRETSEKNMFWLSYQTKGSRRRPFWLTKGQTESESYHKMLEMIWAHRPDLFDAKTTELGTI